MKLFTTIFATALLGLPAAAQAQVVAVPVRTAPMFTTPVVHLPTSFLVTPKTDQWVDITLPVPQIPGVPMYRLPSIKVPGAVATPLLKTDQAAPIPVMAHGIAPNQAHPGKLHQHAAMGRTVSAIRKAFSLHKDEDKPSEKAIRRAFDGGKVQEDAPPVLVEEPSRPQTLPEDDLLREIGIF